MFPWPSETDTFAKTQPHRLLEIRHATEAVKKGRIRGNKNRTIPIKNIHFLLCERAKRDGQSILGDVLSCEFEVLLKPHNFLDKNLRSFHAFGQIRFLEVDTL